MSAVSKPDDRVRARSDDPAERLRLRSSPTPIPAAPAELEPAASPSWSPKPGTKRGTGSEEKDKQPLGYRGIPGASASPTGFRTGDSSAGKGDGREVAKSPLHTFDRDVIGYQNHAQTGSMFFISPDGKAEWFRNGKLERKVKYTVDPRCALESQTFAAQNEGMTLGYPFLVGIGKACHFDDEAKTLRALPSFNVPAMAFIVAYFSEDATTSHFLLNGAPDARSGYIHVLAFDRATKVMQSHQLLRDVPGHSGAMLSQADAFWVSTSLNKTNDLHSAPRARLLELIGGGSAATFASVFTRAYAAIPGVMTFLLRNDVAFLAYNSYPTEESFSLTSGGGVRKKAVLPCVPVAPNGKNFFVLCNGKTLENWSN